jgi:HEPN domain-containing protein
VIVNQKEAADRADHWEVAERRLIDAYLFEKIIRTPVNFIVHSLQEVNDQLAHGRVFFGEIVKDGAILYESDHRPLATLKPKTPQQAYETAKEYFEDHFTDAMRRFEGAQFFRSKKYLKEAAFELHQAAEQLYQGVLLTLTFYTPYDHNIIFLRDTAEQREPRLFDVWPRGTRVERATYQKLKEAYRQGRYSKHYKISDEELAWLSERIEILGQRMHDICSEHVARLAEAAGIEE